MGSFWDDIAATVDTAAHINPLTGLADQAGYALSQALPLTAEEKRAAAEIYKKAKAADKAAAPLRDAIIKNALGAIGTKEMIPDLSSSSGRGSASGDKPGPVQRREGFIERLVNAIFGGRRG